MVPHAISLVLALLGTCVAADADPVPYPGPVRLRRQYENASHVESTPSAPPSTPPIISFSSADYSSTALEPESTTASSSGHVLPAQFSYPPIPTPPHNASHDEPPMHRSGAEPNSSHGSSGGGTAASSYAPVTTLSAPSHMNASRTAPLPSGSVPSRPGPMPFSRGTAPTGGTRLGTRPVSGVAWPQPTNGTCGGATMNIVNASLNWWYSETYTQIDSTFLIQLNAQHSSTGWTLLPATDTFNVTSAVEVPTCVSATAFNTRSDETMLEYSCWDTPTPVAVQTTTVEQTAYIPVNQTTSHGSIPDVVTTPTPAAITAGDPSSGDTYSAGTPFVHFSEFEVVSKRPQRQWYGPMQCVTTTKVHTLADPQSFEYMGDDQVDSLLAKGRIRAAVLQAIEDDSGVALSSVSLGTWKAEPTVVVVVQKILAAALPKATGVMQSASGLETPTPTLPPGLSLVQTTPTDTGTIWVPLTARIESSAESLLVPTVAKTSSRVIVQVGGVTKPATAKSSSAAPFVAHIESSVVTLAVPVDASGTKKVVTTVYSGRTITATRVADSGSGGQGPGDADPGRLISAVISAAQPTNAAQVLSDAEGTNAAHVLSDAKPTNAAQVLSNAEHTFADSHPTAVAIVPGKGGLHVTSAGTTDSDADSHSGGNIVFTIGTSVVTATRVGAGLAINGQTASAQGPAITIDGTPIAVAPGASAVVIGGETIHLLSPTNPGAAANIPLITIGSQVFTANAATQFNIGGSVLTPGGTVVRAGTTISLSPGATRVVINGHTLRLSPPVVTPAPALTLGATVYQPNSGRTYYIDGKLLTPGGVVVVAGTTISLPADGSSVVVNGLAQSVGAAATGTAEYATITAPPVLTIDGEAYSAQGGFRYVISGQTLTPGGAITIDGPTGRQTISLNAAANEIVSIENGHTASSYIGMIGAAPGGAPVLTIDGVTYTAVDYNVGSGATYIIDSQTLTPGGAITITGANGATTISLLPGGTALSIASSEGTTTSKIDSAYGVKPTAAPILTIGGETFTAINIGATYIIHGETLTPGGVDTVTIAGHTYVVSLSPHATMLTIVELGADGRATSTTFETLFPATAVATGTTVYRTALADGATATGKATRSSFGGSPTTSSSASLTNSASSFSILPYTGAAIALGSLVLALWL